MSTVIRLSESQMQALETYQNLRTKQLELMAQNYLETRAYKSYAKQLKGMSLSDVLTSALDFSIECLESDIECLTMPTEEPLTKKTTKKASK